MHGAQHHPMRGVLMAQTKFIQIFLCHTNEDQAAVLEIYDRLKALGYTRLCSF